MIGARNWPLLALAMLSACATTETVLLLPGEDGQPDGEIAVLDSGESETVIDEPMTQTTLGRGAQRPRRVERLDPQVARLIAGLPPAPVSFVFIFPQGQPIIPSGQRVLLEQIRYEVARRPGAQIEIAGFTDSAGDETANDSISFERAQAIAQQLREFGFPIENSDVIGRGEREARAELGDDVADERYRKVVVTVR